MKKHMKKNLGLEHMTRDHYAAIGMVVNTVAQIDELLDQIIIAMLDANPVAYTLLTLLNAKSKRNFIIAMAKTSNWTPEAVSRFGKLMARAKKASALRNTVAHCTFKAGLRPGPSSPCTLGARATRISRVRAGPKAGRYLEHDLAWLNRRGLNEPADAGVEERIGRSAPV
jgi:hypothetical protein